MRGFARPIFANLTGYIYFIQMDRIGPIKIGFTKDIGKRLISLQTANPYPLNLLCVFPGNEEMEKDIHQGFNEMRMEGEWFLPHKFILSEIQEQNRVNTRKCFRIPRPEIDLHDESLDSPYWDAVIAKKMEIREGEG